MLLIGLSFASFISTLIGGLFALHFRKYTHLLLAFTAGVLISLCVFNLFPEIMELSAKGSYGLILPLSAGLIGYAGFHIYHHILHRHHDHGHQKNPAMGVASALALASHSFLDGIAIGVAFQVNVQIGFVVALAVIAHDFADGLNAVSIVLAYRNSMRRAGMLLALVALAPVLGVISTQFLQIPESLLLFYLAGFAGFIMYLLGKDILPHVFKYGQIKTSLALIAMGMVFLLGVTNFTYAIE